jgi:phage FluMu gp28-like protein
MRPFIDGGFNCHNSWKAAVRETGATGIRGVTPAEARAFVKTDCRFPPFEAIATGARVAAEDFIEDVPAGIGDRPKLGHTTLNEGLGALGGGTPVSPFCVHAPGFPGAVSHRDKLTDMPVASAGNQKPNFLETKNDENARLPATTSAGQTANGSQNVFVAGSSVDGGGVDALVPGDSLNEPDVAGGAVRVGEGRMPERMKVECLVEPGSALPFGEEVTQRPGGELSAASGNEEWRGAFETLAATALPADEFAQLVPNAIGQKDLLADGLLGAALEDAQGNASPNPAVIVEHIANAECSDFVLAKAGAQGQGKEDMISESATVLASDAQEAGLLELSEGSGRLGDGIGVGGHEGSPADSHAPVPPQSKSNRQSQSVAGPLLVVKRTEQDLLDWLGTELGFLTGIGRYNEEPIAFEPYQLAFLSSSSKYRWVEKSRQVGFSFLFACEAIARCHLRDAHSSIMVSYNLEDAKEKVNYARQLAEELPLAFRKKIVTDSKTELGFVSNSAAKGVSRIISNPSKAPRGKKGDLYLDELAHYGNDREVYKGSTALILRSRGQLTGCSSPLGRRGVFWEIARQEMRQYKAYWRQQVPWWLCSFFSTDVPRAAQEAMAMSTEDRVRAFGTKDIQDQFDSLIVEDFQQEFELSYCDESYSFFPYELILPCTSDELTVAQDFASLAEPKGRLVAGFDVGRKRDLSELAIFEDADGKKQCRLLRSYDKAPFAEQEAELRRMLSMLPIARLSIDQNGLGMHLAENLRRDFPNVVPETFTNESKETWANDFKILLQRKDVALPKDRDLVSQIHSVKRRITPSGKAAFEVERDEVGHGHADRFWAVALACQKERGPMPGAVPEINVRILG